MTKTDYIEGTILQLELWGEQFATLEGRVSRSKAGRRADLRAELQTLERRRLAIKRQLHLASRSATPGWEELRSDLEGDLDEFRARAIKVHDDVLEV